VTSCLASAGEWLARLQRRELSSVELLRQLLARCDTLHPALNAVVVRDADRALARAAQADAARARGEDWGALHGLPMTVKESFDVAGLPTTWGHESLRGNVATHHATAVQRLVDAGAIVFGKTNVPVSLADWQTFNPVYGTTNNPWDVSRTPGGSSGGSAAALAAGLTPLELGSDIGASIRNPAHYCGVYGHKPTWGVVPMAGHQVPGVACIDSLDIAVAGPMARSAADLRLALDVLTRPLQRFGPLGWHPAAWRPPGPPPPRLRVALWTDDPVAPVDAAVQARLQALADFLRQQGVAVDEDTRPVDSAETHFVYLHLLRAATGAWLDGSTWMQFRERAARYAADDRRYEAAHYRGSTLSHRDWVALDQRRTSLRHQWNDFFTRYDLLITPVACTTAFAHHEHGERWERLVPVNGTTRPGTDSLFWAGLPGVVGLPATAFPLGCAADGLPVGAQVIGPAMADPDTLRFAHWLEQTWRGFEPPPMATSLP
jgi:amidase